LSAIRIPPHPLVPEALRKHIAEGLKLAFSAPGGQQTGCREVAPRRFVFGVESGWSVNHHDLQVRCEVPAIDAGALFGANGVVCRTAGLGISLEWSSIGSARREMTPPTIIRAPAEAVSASLVLGFDIPAGSMRGTMKLSLQIIVAESGVPDGTERHLANTKGFRLGPLSDEFELEFDGDGSLFPITEREGDPTEALWQFCCLAWDDILVDEFSPEHLSLSINLSHSSFSELKGGNEKPYQTNLFRQVVASWLTLFVLKVKERSPSDATWDAICQRLSGTYLPGSIADAAAYLITVGELDVSSAESLMETSQRWIDKSITGVQ